MIIHLNRQIKMPLFILSAITIGLFLLSVIVSAILAQTVHTVRPTIQTGPAHNPGDTADDSAVWIHPTDPMLSVVIGNDKDGGLIVWDLDGKELQYFESSKRMNNLDLRYNFPLSGTYSTGQGHSTVDLVGVVNENQRRLSFYKVNSFSRNLEPVGEIPLSTADPYGGCMYLSPITGKYYFFVNWKSGIWQQVEIISNGSTISGNVVRTHDSGTQTEGCVADDVHKLYYIGEEPIGIWRYGAEPGDGTSRVQIDKTGSGGNLATDVEGMSLYYQSDGTGYLIVSSQGDSTFSVYERVSGGGANPFIGKFRVGSNGSIDSTSSTDGLDVTNFPLGSAFPYGLLVVHDHSNSGADASNHKYVPFERVAEALGLSKDTSWNPREVGLSSATPTAPTDTQTPTVTTLAPGTTPTAISADTPMPTQTPTPTVTTPTPTSDQLGGELISERLYLPVVKN